MCFLMYILPKRLTFGNNLYYIYIGMRKHLSAVCDIILFRKKSIEIYRKSLFEDFGVRKYLTVLFNIFLSSAVLSRWKSDDCKLVTLNYYNVCT